MPGLQKALPPTETFSLVGLTLVGRYVVFEFHDFPSHSHLTVTSEV